MISEKHKFIFIHIPKAGGTSIWKSLEPAVKDLEYSGHDAALKLNHKSHLNAYFIFTAIRNPWDIVVSNYFYIRKKKSFWHSSDGSTKYGLKPYRDQIKDISFKRFVELLGAGKIDDKYVNWTQSRWLRKHYVDYYIRFENLEEGFHEVCSILKLPKVELLKLNSTKHKPYWEYYDDETRDIVAKKYKKDIESFKYKFGE